MCKRIEHVGIMASDTGALSRWYETVLDFRILKEVPGKQSTFLLRQNNGGPFLEILPAPEDFKMPDQAARRFVHLALLVEDIDVAISNAASQGVEMEGEIREAPGNARLALVRDPEGNMLQFVERSIPPDWLT